MAQGLRILIIDDDKSVRDILSHYLATKSFEPLLAVDGPSGLALIKKCPDIVMVLLDWMMPGMDGLEVLEEIKNHPEAPPVAMLTAKIGKNDVLRALKAGAADYLVKPIQKDAFLKKIMTILNRNLEDVKMRAAKRKPMNLDCVIEFPIHDISETGVAIISSFPIRRGELIALQSSKFVWAANNRTGETQYIRVAQCFPFGRKFCIGGEFVGLSPDAIEGLVKLADSGG